VSDTLARLRAALADRYHLERELGAGGMATVYLAEDLKHRRNVAVKVLRPELAHALGPERFLREIETTAHLRHPHILPLFDSGEAHGFLFYAMPLVEGESLRDRLTREKQLPIDDALQIAREVADALGYAHSHRIVHRDIKPENIMLESGHAVVADFGIARAVSSAVTPTSTLTEAGLAVGTPAYMSPEQAVGERTVDGRSDLYSLGCVLFEMLAGQPPFTGPTAQVLARQHIATAPPPVTRFRPAVPANVVEALAKALAKNPADRFDSVGQFTAALRRGPGHRRAVGSRIEPAPTRRALALLAAVLLLVGGWWAMRARAGGDAVPSGSTKAPRSIAVLPFRNLRGDSTGDYFSDGVTEEILHALVQIPDLQVAARSSAFQFRGKAIDVREVGRRLNVAAVLEGSIQREGDKVRITTQLTDTRTGYQIWSGKFDRHLADLFVVEDEISRALADTLKIPLGLVARPVIGTTHIGAHDLYLRGLTLLSQRGSALHQTIAYFQGAVANDSTFAPAWAGLAAAYELLPAYGLSSYEEELPRAEHAARRAIALDSTLGPAFAVLASVYRDRTQWADAERAYARALRLAPNDAETVEQYGQFLFWTGQPAAAVTRMELARKLDPLAPIPATTLGVAHLFLHHYDSAATLLRHASELAPDLPLPWMWQMWTGLSAGRYDLADQAGRRLAEVSGVDPGIYAGLIRGVADPRRRREALALLARAHQTALWALSADYRVNWFMLLGDTAAAIDAVDRLRTRPTPNGILTLWNPPLDPIRDHPRFRATLQRLGLPFHSQGQP
jgi:serine/threonine-protein kinase